MFFKLRKIPTETDDTAEDGMVDINLQNEPTEKYKYIESTHM